MNLSDTPKVLAEFLEGYPKTLAEFKAFISKKFEMSYDWFMGVHLYTPMPFELQTGVYEAFFISVGIEVFTDKVFPIVRFKNMPSLRYKYYCQIFIGEGIVYSKAFEDLHKVTEAKTAALKEAARIREEQLNKQNT